MKKRSVKEPLLALVFVLLAALLIALASTLLRPARVDYGAVWGPYLAEPEDSLDYLYLGSSYAYCDVNPGVIYGESGLTGYVMAGPELTMSQSYYYLKEALKTQSPAVVFIEASALHFDRYQNYTQVNVGYMPLGKNKLDAIFQASEPELRTGLLFDLYFYHNRWKDLALSDAARALTPPAADRLKGYTAVDGIFEGISDGPFRRDTKSQEVYRENMAWLSKMLSLCTDRGIQPVVVFHPTYSQLPPEDYDQIRRDVEAAAPNALYLDWSDNIQPVGLDPALHFYDPGHLNQPGAALFSAWEARFMTDVLGLTPRPQTPDNAAAWTATAEQWTSVEES